MSYICVCAGTECSESSRNKVAYEWKFKLKDKFSAKGKLKNVVRIYLSAAVFRFCHCLFLFFLIRLPLTRGLKTAQSLWGTAEVYKERGERVREQVMAVPQREKQPQKTYSGVHRLNLWYSLLPCDLPYSTCAPDLFVHQLLLVPVSHLHVVNLILPTHSPVAQPG